MIDVQQQQQNKYAQSHYQKAEQMRWMLSFIFFFNGINEVAVMRCGAVWWHCIHNTQQKMHIYVSFKGLWVDNTITTVTRS